MTVMTFMVSVTVQQKQYHLGDRRGLYIFKLDRGQIYTRRLLLHNIEYQFSHGCATIEVFSLSRFTIVDQDDNDAGRSLHKRITQGKHY